MCALAARGVAPSWLRTAQQTFGIGLHRLFPLPYVARTFSQSSTPGFWPEDADDPQNSDEVRELYDKWADTYETTLEKWGWEGPERVAETYSRHGKLSGAILDVGCGTGLSGTQLRAKGCTSEIVGLDISEQSLYKAQNKTCEIDGEVRKV